MTDLGQISTALAVVVAAGSIAGGLVRAAGALLRAAASGHDVVQAVEENTAATSVLSEQFRAYQQITDRRLEILEEAHRDETQRRTGRRSW